MSAWLRHLLQRWAADNAMTEVLSAGVLILGGQQGSAALAALPASSMCTMITGAHRMAVSLSRVGLISLLC